MIQYKKREKTDRHHTKSQELWLAILYGRIFSVANSKRAELVLVNKLLRETARLTFLIFFVIIYI